MLNRTIKLTKEAIKYPFNFVSSKWAWPTCRNRPYDLNARRRIGLHFTD
jgi:hypothetical protein